MSRPRSESPDRVGQRASNARTAVRLGAVVLAMFGFGYALVPLYSVFCELTGLNGKTGVAQASEVDGIADDTREIVVEFIGEVNSALPWEVEPVQRRMRVHPGKIYETAFRARNVAAELSVGQAVPSVAPSKASLHFNKTECFCFTRQTFEAGEEREMPVRFVISRDLPPDVRTVTLSYTFFRTDAEG